MKTVEDCEICVKLWKVIRELLFQLITNVNFPIGIDPHSLE